MNRIFKGSVLMVVAIAASLALVTSANATITTSDGKPVTLSAKNTTFTASGGTISCPTSTVVGTPTGTSSVSTAGTNVTFGTGANCPTSAGTNASVAVTPGNWTITVTKDLGGGSFQVSISISSVVITAGFGCQITVPAQTISGTFTNNTKSLVVNTNVTYTASAICSVFIPTSGSANFTSGTTATLTTSLPGYGSPTNLVVK